MNPPIEMDRDAHDRIITNRASSRQIIDKARRQRYVAIRDNMLASVCGSGSVPSHSSPAAAIDRRRRRSTPLTLINRIDWENAPWHDPRRSLPASGPT